MCSKSQRATTAGLGIRSLVFWANCSFIVSKRVIRSWKRAIPSLVCHEQQEQIAHNHFFCKEQRERFAYSHSFLKINGSHLLKVILFLRLMSVNCSCCSLKKSNWAKSDGSDSHLGIKKGKNCQKHKKNMFFFEWIALFWELFSQIMSESLTWLFFKEIESNLLMVTLL